MSRSKAKGSGNMVSAAVSASSSDPCGQTFHTMPRFLHTTALSLLFCASSSAFAPPQRVSVPTSLFTGTDEQERRVADIVKEIKDDLADADVNGDGKIDAEELRAVLSSKVESPETLSISDEAVVITSATGSGAPIFYNNVEGKGMDERVYTFNKTLIDLVYNIICFLYPVKGTDRDFARFYVLETVARVPYFAYLSVLHFRETFGQRYDGEDNLKNRMRTHYAEADNEMHHLLIMESLGGNSNPVDRFVAQTMAFLYYWYVIPVFAVSEPAAYHLSELIENHAYNTYNGYLTEHEAMLKTKPVPAIAHEYYEEEDPFLFDMFCTVKDMDADNHYSARRPKLESLYDVFVNIRDDESEHWKTLCNLVQFNDMHGADSKHVHSTKPEPAAAA